MISVDIVITLINKRLNSIQMQDITGNIPLHLECYGKCRIEVTWRDHRR
jgi:hypothetical protein